MFFTNKRCFLVKEKTDCISSMRPLFVISKFFACNLFYLPPNRSSNEPIQMKAIDYVIVLLYAVLYVVFVFPFFGEMVFERTNSLLPSGNVVIIYLVRIIFYFILIANFSSYIMETVNRTKIWRLFTMLYDFDEEANNLGIKVVNNNMVFLIYVSRLLIMQVTIIMICTTITYFHVDQYWLYLQFYFSYTMMDGCYTTTFCVYNYFVFRFRDRFVNINEALRDLLNIQNGSTIQLDTENQNLQKQSNVVKKLANLYSILTDCMRLHSECYSVQIAVIVAVVFQFTLVCFYMIYQLFRGYTTNTLLITFAYSTRTFYFYSQILFAMKYGTMLSTEATYTSHILNKALNLPLNKPTLNQLQQFLQQISHSNTSVSCGLFSIDWTLFHTMIAGVVSYQVLFVQFDNLVTTAKLYVILLMSFIR